MRTALRPRVMILSAALLGLLFGVGAGILARIWMRLIATGSPEFHWGGTLLIVGIFAAVGLLSGLVMGLRKAHWTGRRFTVVRIVTGSVSTLILCLGQGLFMAPTVILGGLAIGRPTWKKAVRVALVVTAMAWLVVVNLVVALRDWPHSWWRWVAAVAVSASAYLLATFGVAQSYAGRPISP